MATLLEIIIQAQDKASATFKGVETSAQKLGSVLSTTLKVGAAAGAASMLALGASSIKAASDYNESLSKVRVVFRDTSPVIEAFAKSASRDLGLSQKAALESAGTFGNLFVAMKLGRPAAADMSVGIVKLASDLASFNNIGTEEVLVKLRAGLVGEAEPLRTLGVNLNAADIAARAMAMGLAKSKEALTAGDKAMAAYSLIMEQTKTAQGDFARTSDGLANQQKKLAASFDDLKVTLGQKLQPVAQKVFAYLINTIQSPSFQQGVAKWSGAIETLVREALPDLQTMAKSFSDVAKNVDQLANSLQKLSGLKFGSGIADFLNDINRRVTNAGLVTNRLLHDATFGAVPLADANKQKFGANSNLSSSALPTSGISVMEFDLETGMSKAGAAMVKADLAAKAAATTFNDDVTPAFTSVAASGAKARDVMQEWREALDKTLEDGSISFREFQDLNLQASKDGIEGLDAVMAGHLEAQAALAAVSAKADEQTYTFTSTMTKLTDVFKTSTAAGKQLLLTMGQETLAKLMDAAHSVAGGMTQEQARLQLELATAQERVAGFAASGATDAQLAQSVALVDNISKQVAVGTAHVAVLNAQIDVENAANQTEAQRNKLVADMLPMIRDQSIYQAQLNRELMPAPQIVADAMNAFRMFTLYMQTAMGSGGSLQLAGRGV